MDDSQKEIIKNLEKEIVILQDDQTAMIKQKWRLEDDVRKHQDRIRELEVKELNAKKKVSTWKKVTAVLVAAWALVLSLFNFDKK